MSVVVYSAGSLRKALPAMVEAVGLQMDIVFGPAGLLRKHIEEGARPDLFLSANMAHARVVAELAGYGPAQEFAGNQLCLLGWREVLEGGDALAIMLNPKCRLGTSTPGADPGGDYAFSVFDRAAAVQPGSREQLLVKAMPLVGGGMPGNDGPTQSPVLGLFEENRVDVFLGYRTTALDVMNACPWLTILDLPAELAVQAVYGAVVIEDDPEAAQAYERLRSPEAVEVLERFGFSGRGSGL